MQLHVSIEATTYSELKEKVEDLYQEICVEGAAGDGEVARPKLVPGPEKPKPAPKTEPKQPLPEQPAEGEPEVEPEVEPKAAQDAAPTPVADDAFEDTPAVTQIPTPPKKKPKRVVGKPAVKGNGKVPTAPVEGADFTMAQNALQILAQKKGVKPALATLSEFGAKKIQDIQANQFGDFVARCNTLSATT